MKKCEKLAEAKLKGFVRYFTERPCKKGHICERLVSDRSCVMCNVEKAQIKRDAMSAEDKYKKGLKYRYLQEKWLQTENGKNSRTATSKKYYQNNKEKLSDCRKEYNKKTNNFHSIQWKKENPEQVYAATAKRRAAKLQRTPSWLNAGHWLEIDSIYELCNAWRSIGFDYHVDHIVPLQGKNVSGFHVPWNLQIIHAKENLSKANRV